jgi:hypothetical protein
MTEGSHNEASSDEQERSFQKFQQRISIPNDDGTRCVPDHTVQTLSI